MPSLNDISARYAFAAIFYADFFIFNNNPLNTLVSSHRLRQLGQVADMAEISPCLMRLAATRRPGGEHDRARRAWLPPSARTSAFLALIGDNLHCTRAVVLLKIDATVIWDTTVIANRRRKLDRSVFDRISRHPQSIHATFHNARSWTLVPPRISCNKRWRRIDVARTDAIEKKMAPAADAGAPG